MFSHNKIGGKSGKLKCQSERKFVCNGTKHAQSIDVETVLQNIIHPRATTSFTYKDEKVCRTYRNRNCKNSQIKSWLDNILKRADIVIFDEAGVIPDSTFSVLEPYAVQNASFQLGSGMSELDVLVEPTKMPHKLIYVSSASSMDSYFYRKYKEAWINQMAGNPHFFCLNLPSDGIINATKDGEKLVEPLLTQETVDSALRNDRAGALKEYLNQFDQEGGEQSIISRSAIIKNSYPYLPEYANIDNNSFYVIAWDPARRLDNSCCLIARLWKDPHAGWRARLVNCVVLIDTMSKGGTMLSAPQQVEEIKKLLIAYNGKESACWEHIMGLCVDAGSGGGGTHMTDFLCMDFDVNGVHYKGLVDPGYNDGDAKKFPDADKGTLQLVSPKLKAEMYEAAIQMIAQGVVEFPEDYNSNGHIDLIYEVDKNGEKKQRFSFPTEAEEHKLNKIGSTIEVVRNDLDHEQERTLTQMNMLKNELVNIWRYKTSTGASRFDLSPDKANIMHDDRAYCFVLLMKFLSDLRRQHVVNKKPAAPQNFVDDFLPIKGWSIHKTIG